MLVGFGEQQRVPAASPQFIGFGGDPAKNPVSQGRPSKPLSLEDFLSNASLGEIVDHQPTRATILSQLIAENERLKRRAAELENAYAPVQAQVLARGLVEACTVKLFAVKVTGGIPMMDVPPKRRAEIKTGRGGRNMLADPYVRFEWTDATGRIYSVKTTVLQNQQEAQWDETLTFTLPGQRPPLMKLVITLWDHDVTNPDDLIGTARFDLTAATGRVTGHPMDLEANLPGRAELNTNVSFEFTRRATFVRPEELTVAEIAD